MMSKTQDNDCVLSLISGIQPNFGRQSLTTLQMLPPQKREKINVQH